MSTQVQHIYQAPRAFLADEPSMSGQCWDPFVRRVVAFLKANPTETVIASTDWEPSLRATRFTLEGGTLRAVAVRVHLSYTVETPLDGNSLGEART